jgi:subtilisin family serine protease
LVWIDISTHSQIIKINVVTLATYFSESETRTEVLVKGILNRAAAASLTLLAILSAPAFAQAQGHVQMPAGLDSSPYIGAPVTSGGPAIAQRIGQVQVAIKLVDAPLVVAVGANAKQNGIAMSTAQQQAYVAQINQKQDAVMTQARALGAVELGRVSKAHNALIVTIDASQVQSLQSIGGVAAVRSLLDPPLTNSLIPGDTNPDLANVAAYIGAAAVRQNGYTGQGVRVAMLDTGIDYTHYNLGGSGNVADYNTALAVATGTPPPNLFPTSKVVGGYDFVGEVWPNGPLAPDPNPLDLNGHGSHTADILGGKSLDGVHVGIAPGTQLYAVKVCSSVSTACSGIAILEGLDFALDPTGTGTLNNAVDLISMSIGGDFGQREADDQEAFTDIVQFGVVAVVSAGNSGNIPYVLAGPAATPEVLAAGATTSVVAVDIPLVINSPAAIAGSYTNTATLDFAPITGPVNGNIAYVGQGCPASGATPADTYLANPAGKIALIDRGVCAVSLKIDRAAQAGAIGVLIGLTAPGDAVSFSNGGGTNFVPTLVITQATSNSIKSALASNSVNGTISPANAIPLSGNMASFSSRGPNFSYSMLKPDLAAPGTISAAQPGTGFLETTESGTSFACPTEAGVAALLLSKNRMLAPLDIKTLLMENSEAAVYINNATQPGVLAPMSWMGAGEVRADRATASTTAAWDSSDPLAVSISFGTTRLFANQTLRKKIVVRNYTNHSRLYTLSNSYRDAPNMTGVTLLFPATVSVPANGSATFNLSATINTANLPLWPFVGGSNSNNGNLLQSVEYAGYLTLTDAGDAVHLPWHILPHKADNLSPSSTSVSLGGNPQILNLTNSNGAVTGQVDTFSLTGVNATPTNPEPPPVGSDAPVINLHAAGLRLICLSADCSQLGVQFAINTFEQRAHPDVPAEFDVHIDVNNDGTDDFVVFNEDIGLATTGVNSGQNGVFVADLTNNTASGPYFYSIADLSTANIILTAPLSALQTSTGLQLGVSSPFTFSVLAFDNYFTGNLTDMIGPMRYELDMPKFYSDLATYSVPPNGSVPAVIIPNNAANPYFTGPYNGNSPSQTGLLLMYRDAVNGHEVDLVNVN